MYFENKFIQFVNDLSLENINKQLRGYDFSSSSLKKNSEYDQCFAKMQFLLQFLESSFFQNQQLPVISSSECKRKTLFVCKGKREKGSFPLGKGHLCEKNKFLILKESYTDVSNFSVPNYLLESSLRKCQQLLEKGVIVQKNNLFDSLSGAVTFITSHPH